MDLDEPYRWEDGDLIFQAKVIPRAKQDVLQNDDSGGIRIRIKAAPVDGQANQAVVQFLSKAFGVNRSSIILLSGKTSRQKRFKVCKPSQLPEIFSK